MANLGASVFGAPLSVGIPARSLAVVRCGGTTGVANLLHAVVLVAILWLGSGFVAHIPIPAPFLALHYYFAVSAFHCGKIQL